MSNEIEHGGPAFPADPHAVAGMSLRDYFAAKAMAGLMGRVWDTENNSGEKIIEMWAKSAYAVADAMIAARSKA